jgi:hypothetical protein
MLRTELKIEEFAKLLRANLSHTITEVTAAAAGINHGSC